MAALKTSNGGMGRRGTEDTVPSMVYYEQGSKTDDLRSRPSLLNLHSALNQGFVPDTPNQATTHSVGESIDLSANSNFGDEDVNKQEGPAETRVTLQHPQVKFGWIRGVLIRCILSILGTLIYLRLGWVAGQAGILIGVLIAVISTVIVTLTALSMCALCTNGEINAGGAYFMLSRSLGPEFGGSMGVIFALADAVAAAMNVVGFAETVRDLLKRYSIAVVDDTNSVRIIGAVTMLILFTIGESFSKMIADRRMCMLFTFVMISVAWEAKVELGLLALVTLSYASYIIGTMINPSDAKRARGVTGYQWSTFKENLQPSWTGQETFVTVFAIYFPSITGIMAGAGISGELKEPDKSLPKGTLLGIFITSLVYMSGIVLTGATCLRHASGNIEHIHNLTLLTACRHNNTCTEGLLHNYNIMEIESLYWVTIVIGTFATSISSALTLIVTSPRTLQALAKDKLFPYTHFLGKGSGKDGEPRLAYCVVLVIAMLIISIGDLNLIAPLISNFYLASFALINYACFDGSLSKSPGWRPAFKYYNMWVALFGAGLCIFAMFLMQWATALVTIAIMFFLYVYVLRSKPTVNWGSSGQAHMYRTALKDMLHLVYLEDHVKNYRPSILIYSGNPVARPCLIDFFANITKDISLLVCGDVIVATPSMTVTDSSLRKRSRKIQYWLRKRKIKAFFNPVVAPTYQFGCKALLQLAGLGNLKPNIAAFGFKRNWKQCSIKDVEEYFSLIHEIFDQQMGLAILYRSDGFDFSDRIMYGKRSGELGELLEYMTPTLAPVPKPKFQTATTTPSFSIKTPVDGVDSAASTDVPKFTFTEAPVTDGSEKEERGITEDQQPKPKVAFQMNLRPRSRNSSLSSIASCASSSNDPESRAGGVPSKSGATYRGPYNRRVSQLQRELDLAMDAYRLKRKHGVVDVWWLNDDGGLTLLLAHLITSKRSYLGGANMRLFTFASNKDKIPEEKQGLQNLLEKFRIKCSEINVIGDETPPHPWTIGDFERTVNMFKRSLNDPDYIANPVYYVTDNQLDLLKYKTSIYLKTRDLVAEMSKNSDLIIITMPIPRRGREGACLYFTWLEMLTRGLSTSPDTPVMLIRGNQEDVLTFYS